MTPSRPGVVSGAAALLGTVPMIWFVMRKVVGTAALPGFESRINYSWEVYTRSVLASRQLPYWNPFHFSGTPHLANTQMLVFYPPALVLRWLDPVSFTQWMTIGHLLLGAAGMVYLARVIGAGWIGAVTASLAVVAGGTAAGWLHHGHLLLLYCAPWLPWALALAIRSSATARIAPQVWLVLVLVCQFLAGYTQGFIYGAGAIAGYFAYCVVWPTPELRAARWRPLLQLTVLLLLVGGLAAFQLWPMIRLAAESGRMGGVGYEIAVQDAWRFDDLASLFLPFHGVRELPLHRLLGDRSAYVGWLSIAMVPFAFTRPESRRIAVFLVLLAAASVVIALGDRLLVYRLHYLMFPGLRVPGRVLFLAAVAFAGAGALGLTNFLALCHDRRWRQIARPASIAVAWAAASVVTGLSVSRGGVAPAHLWPWLALLAIAAVVLIAVACATRHSRLAAVFVIAFVAVDLGAFSANAVLAAPAPVTQGFAQLSPARGGRTLATCWIDLGEMMESGRPAVDGLGGMYLRDYADWAFLVRTGNVPEEKGLITPVGSLDGTFPARRDLVDFSNVTTVVACSPIQLAGFSGGGRLRGYAVYRNDTALPRAFWTCAAEELSRAEIVNRLVHARYSATGVLSLSHPISVRWRPGINDIQRTAVEAEYHLGTGEPTDVTTRRYLLTDPDQRTLLLLVGHPAIEDTNGFDRDTGAVPGFPAAPAASAGEQRQLLIGTRQCPSGGEVDVDVEDRPDGQVLATVHAPSAGYVYFNEPHYSQRHAFIDGVRVDVQKANLAFTAVPVSAGRHRVELRYVPTDVYTGSAISVLTLLGWVGATRGTKK
jgi:hypothetical protein